MVARNADRAEAGSFAERVCELFRRHAFEVGASAPVAVTCSVGLAAFPLADLPWERVVELADHCLYEAKRAGKNCWVAVEGGPDLEASALRQSAFSELVAQGRLVLTASRQAPGALRAVE